MVLLISGCTYILYRNSADSSIQFPKLQHIVNDSLPIPEGWQLRLYLPRKNHTFNDFSTLLAIDEDVRIQYNVDVLFVLHDG